MVSNMTISLTRHVFPSFDLFSYLRFISSRFLYTKGLSLRGSSRFSRIYAFLPCYD
jgi:hypothetical protein